MKAKEVTKIIAKAGGVMIRQRGSHQRWKVEINGQIAHTTIPMHRRDLSIGTLKGIQRDLEQILGKDWLL